jgi:hypothetical protein
MLLWLQLRDEHKAVAATHGSTLGLASLQDMTLTDAAISETLRLAQVRVTRDTSSSSSSSGSSSSSSTVAQHGLHIRSKQRACLFSS